MLRYCVKIVKEKWTIMGFVTGIFRWIPLVKNDKMQAGRGFRNCWTTFGIIKTWKTWLCRWKAAMYICIIKDGNEERHKRQGSEHKVRETRHRKKVTRSESFTSTKNFTFFFIWQAIVRGRLFLQWTFLFLPHPPALWRGNSGRKPKA
jgi:hypothetical protein